MIATTTKQDAIPLLNFYTSTVIFILGALLIFLLVQDVHDTTGFYRLYILMAIQLAPMAISVSRRHNNYISFILFNHFFTYSLAKHNQITNISRSGVVLPQTLHAINELTFCTLLILMCYYLFRQLLFHRFKKRERYEPLYLSRTQTLVLGSYEAFQPFILDLLPRTLHTLHFVTSAAGLVLLFCSVAPGYERLLKLSKIATCTSVAIYFIRTGSLALGGSLAVTLFLVLCLKKEYKKLIYLVAAALAMSAIQPVKGAYRNYLRDNPNSGPIDKVRVVGEMIWVHYAEGVEVPEERHEGDDENGEPKEAEAISTSLVKGFGRIGDDSLERVLSWTPSLVPFWDGESYSNIPFMFIPRFLWPDKPRWTTWNKFGRVYGFLSSDDYTTSVGVSYLGEAYMNFGYTGMYTVALFFGFLVALVERLSYFFMKGYFHFTFICFLIPMMTYAADLGTLMNSIVLMTSIMLALRYQFIKMTQRDEYST